MLIFHDTLFIEFISDRCFESVFTQMFHHKQVTTAKHQNKKRKKKTKQNKTVSFEHHHFGVVVKNKLHHFQTYSSLKSIRMCSFCSLMFVMHNFYSSRHETNESLKPKRHQFKVCQRATSTRVHDSHIPTKKTEPNLKD